MKKFALSLLLISAGFAAVDAQTKPRAEIPHNYRSSFRKMMRKNSGYGLVAIKSNFILHVVNYNLEIVETFTIAVGMNPDGHAKLHENDRRTPEGLYRITEILSSDNSTDPDASKKLEILNSIYFKAKDGFHRYDDASKDLGSALYGPRFFSLSYPEKKDMARYRSHAKKKKLPVDNGKPASIGYGIAIHGTNDEDAIGKKSTNGCIALKNDAVIRLDPYIKLKTPVLILP